MMLWEVGIPGKAGVSDRDKEELHELAYCIRTLTIMIRQIGRAASIRS